MGSSIDVGRPEDDETNRAGSLIEGPGLVGYACKSQSSIEQEG